MKNFLFLLLLSCNVFCNDLSYNIATIQHDINVLNSKDSLTSIEQDKLNELMEQLNSIKKSNPKLLEESIINDLAMTKESDINYTKINKETKDDSILQSRLDIYKDISSNKQLLSNNENIDKSINNQPNLSDEQLDACGAILCLSSSTKPSQCNPYLKRYFSIKKYKKGSFSWSRTINARKAFLNLCPIQNSDENLSSLMNDVLPQQKGNCDADDLNAQTEQRGIMVKTISQLPSYCKSLYMHTYTDIKLPIYKCNNQFYNLSDWKSGVWYERATREDYKLWLNNGNFGKTIKNNNSVIEYYKQHQIIKKCWVNI